MKLPLVVSIAAAGLLACSGGGDDAVSVDAPIVDGRSIPSAGAAPIDVRETAEAFRGRGAPTPAPSSARDPGPRSGASAVGAGLIEAIPDSEIAQHLSATTAARLALGIRGRPNVVLAFSAISGQANANGNDGTFARFGHKAQNKSLLIFSGEAYNVDMGISNGAFPTERDETAGCHLAAMPNSDSTLDGATPAAVLSSVERFTLFMRFLAPPTPSTTVPGGAASIERGRQAFGDVGCALCHTPSMKTYNASVAALREQTVNLYSNLLLHDMGRGLADGVRQGQASGSEFRSAPLWGLGQRLFFLHDGRTSDLRQAIHEHFSDGSEANDVVQRFMRLPDPLQQDLLNFLRSL
ncbi:MAG TPA: di-heme oxidoredictase family protein [Burkholderiaceae bacterium]|nr:di-heme oxidoredictase family protein [Burkholderiaceae bacterium]